MKIKNQLTSLITFHILYGIASFAQVTADFSASPPAGCSPLKVYFTNLSSGSGTLAYQWHLGEQQGISTLKDPQATYIESGTYQIKLVVSNGTDKDSITRAITVFKSPLADFTANFKGCVPHRVNFSDRSLPGDGSITSWNWDFRTGSIDTRKNPVKDYTAAGKYDVFLEVTDENGCKSNIEKSQYIDVADPPIAAFTPSPQSTCTVPVMVQMTNGSTGKELLSYSWDFGDNSTSSEKNPSKTYNQFGNYLIRLSVGSDYGCSDTISSVFYASPVLASGTLSQEGKAIADKDTICTGQVVFSSSSSGSDKVLWKFGDGKTSVSKSGFHVYSQGGNYTVLLIASPGNSCADTMSWNFFMEEPRADFGMSSEYSCKSPALVNFTDNSSGAVAWEWTFSDGTKAATRNASKSYFLPPETDVYKINTTVSFNTALTVTSRNGCRNTLTKPFSIKKPTALFSVDTVQGCIPLRVKYTDHSLSDEAITGRQWIFGDGQQVAGATDSTVHDFTAEGVFLSRLIITNNLGCSDTSYIIPIRPGKKLSPDFNLSKSKVCPGETIQFTDNTPQSSLIQAWHYRVGGQSVDALPGVSDPYWKVDTDTGYHDVKLQVVYNGCVSEITQPKALLNEGAAAGFGFAFDCENPFSYQFTDLSRGTESLKWLFGDNSSDDVSVNPLHTYASAGNYQVRQIAFKGICADTFQMEIKVREPLATISNKTLACAGEPMVFSGVASYDQVDYCFEKYTWDFGDNTQVISTRADSIAHTFSSRGNYKVMLKTQYDNGCEDTASVSIRVYGPYAAFSADTGKGCSPFDVQFTDQSTPDLHPIENWHWDFADNSDTTYSGKAPVIPHRFIDPGVYSVVLTLTDTLGCTGSASDTILSARPDALFYAENPLHCTGSPVNFRYNYLNGDSVIWNFSDGTLYRSKEMPFAHTFSSKGEKSATLTIFQFGCADSYTSPDGYVIIQEADASFAVSETTWNCYPKEIVFTHNPADTIVRSGTWDFGYNNSTSGYATLRRFNYPRPGEYPASLAVETTYGCRDTAWQTIVISGPTGTFDILPGNRRACRGDDITLRIGETNNVFDFEWDLGDGRFMTGDTVTFAYGRMGTLYPKLILYGDSGICIPPPVVDSVLVYEVIAGMELPDTGYCDQYVLHFANTSTGNTQDFWTFSNGFQTGEHEPDLAFSPGDFTATLMVMNDIGCSDTLTTGFVIHPLPVLVLSPDTLICEGDAVIIRASGGDVIQWTPTAGLSDPGTYMPVASPATTTTYTAQVRYLSTGCSNQDQLLIFVQQEPQISIHPYPDTTIIIGEVVAIRADSIGGVTYSWAPAGWLSCTSCASPVAQPLETTRYTLTLADTNQCFEKSYDLDIEVLEEYSLDVPTAFTPNGDDVNDVVFVKGWGIRKLVEFRVFNRWGNQVFFSDDLNLGWDGTFEGKIQSIDSYAYTVTVEMWDGRIVSKKGTINLIR